jgi:REP element-mobilizing transposase RayT
MHSIMNNEPLPRRKSPRLQGYDYATRAAYFVTICTHERYHLFGEVQNGVMILDTAGEIAVARWIALPDHHPAIVVDMFVVMPNHVHAIIFIVGTTPASSAQIPSSAKHPNPAATLGTVVGSYKSGVTRRIRQTLNAPYLDVWQERYHDHIIRDEADLNRIREYVAANPVRWTDDTFYS